ncbi:hypothetical protein K457DRAFT_23048 [Linnemannia elongata AG-77]|uniref:Uncharacterized protein n=1 Tax=Linnemannia elongata AG-77 TaxID=1314771 RepID=A0A197JM71_9FUNG|nr:hypothetical protein K457DRAFT_23048 [Linnemannia elongata AG-77]
MAPILPMTSSFMWCMLLIGLSSDRWNFLVGYGRSPYSMLEKVYKGIRRELSDKGLLTNEAAGEYLMRTEPKAT